MDFTQTGGQCLKDRTFTFRQGFWGTKLLTVQKRTNPTKTRYNYKNIRIYQSLLDL